MLQEKDEITRVRDYIRQHIKLGKESSEFYYCHPSLCILDAIYSISSRYNPTVVNTIKKYCAFYKLDKISDTDRTNRFIEHEDTIQDMVEYIREVGTERFAEEILHNRTKVQNRLKSEIVFDLANYFIKNDIINLKQLSEWGSQVDPDLFKKETNIFGLGPTTIRYLAMLAGNEEFVKPDRHILRFLTKASGRTVNNPKEAEDLLREVARNLNITPSTLDNAIWRYQSSKGKEG